MTRPRGDLTRLTRADERQAERCRAFIEGHAIGLIEGAAIVLSRLADGESTRAVMRELMRQHGADRVAERLRELGLQRLLEAAS